MKPYKLVLAAGLAAGLLIVNSGVMLAQGRLGSGDCTGTGTCQMQGQGNGNRQQGQGNRQGNGPGRHNQQGQDNRQGQGNGQVRNQGQQGNRSRGPGSDTGNWETMLPPKTAGQVPATVVSAMQDGLADELNAYAIYGSVIEQFGSVRPFTNIQKAEARHIAAWEFLFDRYGIPMPATAKVEVPTFASLTDACQAAVNAELANRDLYDKLLTAFGDYPDMTEVATQLRTVTNAKHLPAFQRCAN